MCWHWHSDSTARPCGAGHFTENVYIPSAIMTGKLRRRGKWLNEVFILTLVTTFRRQNHECKTPFHSYTCGFGQISLLLSYYVLNLFFHVPFEFIFSENGKGPVCIEFLDSVSLIKVQCECNMLLTWFLVNVPPWESFRTLTCKSRDPLLSLSVLIPYSWLLP